MLVTGKGLSGGLYPMSATVLTPRAAQWLEQDGWAHVSTFGGAEVGCRVAQKVLEISARPDVLDRVRDTSIYLGAGLEEIMVRARLRDRPDAEPTDVALFFSYRPGAGVAVTVGAPPTEPIATLERIRTGTRRASSVSQSLSRPSLTKRPVPSRSCGSMTIVG